ncbi:MAG: molybdopterin-dependent oxidoreductase [Burkholderiales bacterium]
MKILVVGLQCCALLGSMAWGGAQADCPQNGAVFDSRTLLTVQLPAQPAQAFSLADLMALPGDSFNFGRSVEQAGRKEEQTTRYTGVRLREVLARAGLDEARNRAARGWVVELIATDNYRAVFSWGELFNHAASDSVVVIYAQNGQPLDTVAGPLALRALTDQRPGPRHVRNLCAVRVRELP